MARDKIKKPHSRVVRLCKFKIQDSKFKINLRLLFEGFD